MPREHTFTHAELTDMFPDGIPVSVLLVIERAELAPIAKNAIIREISKEQNPSPAVRTRASKHYAQVMADLAWKAAFKKAHDILTKQLLWANSGFLVSKSHMAQRIGTRLTAASKKPFDMDNL